MLAALLSCPTCNDEGFGFGERCVFAEDCRADLQCLNAICVPRCDSDLVCGEGFFCNAASECEAVVSSVGDGCVREQDCGPGLACLLSSDTNGDGFMDGSCTVENLGGTTGNQCQHNHECRNGICEVGRCTQLCLDNADCPIPFQCTVVLLDESTRFRGCFDWETP